MIEEIVKDGITISEGGFFDRWHLESELQKRTGKDCKLIVLFYSYQFPIEIFLLKFGDDEFNVKLNVYTTDVSVY